MVDYFSNFWEIDRLHNATAATVILKLKNHFARYGCPDILISDNGTQFTSGEFTEFAESWNFEHRTSSPYNSKGNRKVESAVKMAKKILRKSKDAGSDPFMGILDYRNTPTQGMDTSPSQRLMNRRTRTLLPTTKALLKPSVVQADKVKRQTAKRQSKQAEYFHRKARDLPTLDVEDVVRMKPFRLGQKTWAKAIVKSRLDEHLYLIETPDGSTYRRNRCHLKKTSESPDSQLSEWFFRRDSPKQRAQSSPSDRKVFRDYPA